MIAHPTPGRLALFASDDLDAIESESIRAHIEACEPCRAVLGSFSALVDLQRRSPIAQGREELDQIRESVLDRIGHLRDGDVRRSVPWAVCLPLASLAACVALLLTFHRPAPPPPKALELTQSAALPVLLPQPVAFRPLLARSKRKPRPRDVGVQGLSLVRNPDGSGLVRLATADPNVVVLLAYPKEEGESREN